MACNVPVWAYSHLSHYFTSPIHRWSEKLVDSGWIRPGNGDPYRSLWLITLYAYRTILLSKLEQILKNVKFQNNNKLRYKYFATPLVIDIL